jgi:hypothetical protein
MHLAALGNLLRRHGRDDDGDKKLIVVYSFEESAPAEKLQSRVAEVLHEYSVVTVPAREVGEFVANVEKLAIQQHPQRDARNRCTSCGKRPARSAMAETAGRPRSWRTRLRQAGTGANGSNGNEESRHRQQTG